MAFQREAGLATYRQQADLAFFLTIDMLEAGQAVVRHLERGAVGADLERLTRRELKVTRGTAEVLRLAQVNGEVAGVTTDPGGILVLDQRDHLMVNPAPHVPRAGQIGRFLDQLMGKLVVEFTVATAGFDDLQTLHVLDGTLEAALLELTALAHEAQLEDTPQYRGGVGDIAPFFQLIDTTGEQTDQALGQLVQLHRTPFTAVHVETTADFLQVERHAIAALDELAAHARTQVQAITT